MQLSDIVISSYAWANLWTAVLIILLVWYCISFYKNFKRGRVDAFEWFAGLFILAFIGMFAYYFRFDYLDMHKASEDIKSEYNIHDVHLVENNKVEFRSGEYDCKAKYHKVKGHYVISDERISCTTETFISLNSIKERN